MRIIVVEFVVKYWVQFLFGLVTTGLGLLCKKFYSLYNKEKNHQKTEEQKAFYKGLEDLIKESTEESRKGDEKLQEQINVMKGGILSIQGKNFKQECRELLRKERDITLAEFEALQEEHNVYKSLGGNHDGDILFDMVCKKATNLLTDDK